MGNTDTGVFDRDAYGVIVRKLLDYDHNASLVGILERVVYEIGEDFLHFLLVDTDGWKRLFGNSERECEFFGLSREREALAEIGQDGFDLLFFEIIVHSSRFHTGDAEEVFDQIDETVIGIQTNSELA